MVDTLELMLWSLIDHTIAFKSQLALQAGCTATEGFGSTDISDDFSFWCCVLKNLNYLSS